MGFLKIGFPAFILRSVPTNSPCICFFPCLWLASSPCSYFMKASIGNGATAIFAGIVSQILEDSFGHIGPFQGAIALTFLALLLILPWEENYGDSENDGEKSLYKQFSQGWRTTLSHPQIWKIGLTQALSEGAMYTVSSPRFLAAWRYCLLYSPFFPEKFVFMWVPTLLSLQPPGGLPTGCVFSSMMMSITIGGMLYPLMHDVFSRYVVSNQLAPEACASMIYFLAAASMAIPAMSLSQRTIENNNLLLLTITSFLVVEVCVGLFMPVAGTLRSKYVPDALQGAILNIFRLPLNAVVVAGTFATDIFEPSMVFKLVSASFLAASLLQASLTLTPTKQRIKIEWIHLYRLYLSTQQHRRLSFHGVQPVFQLDDTQIKENQNPCLFVNG